MAFARESQADPWSQLTTKLTANRPMPDAVAAYQNCIVQRMQIAVEDGRQLSQDARRITRAITTPVSNGLPKGET
jgi:hypothetical protein